MDISPLFSQLRAFTERPAPFSRYTAAELWNDPHISTRMLEAHLDPDSDRASYRASEIQRIMAWLNRQIDLEGKRLCDLGCGPGLYTTGFHDLGARVTGVDLSDHSIAYAISQAADADQDIAYIHANYLEFDLPNGFDVITLISRDFCALSRQQRKLLLGSIRDALSEGGVFVFDASLVKEMASVREETLLENRLMAGFWAPVDYVGLKRSFVYPEQRVTLDRYLIAEAHRHREIFNWLQYFTAASLAEELRDAGFEIRSATETLSGRPLEPDSSSIGVIASRVHA